MLLSGIKSFNSICPFYSKTAKPTRAVKKRNILDNGKIDGYSKYYSSSVLQRNMTISICCDGFCVNQCRDT